MKKKYPADHIKLLYTDTDSLAYAIRTDDVYKDMKNDATEKYDFSEYPINHPLYSTTNRKLIGFFKDELNSIPLQEYVGLRPKCYSLKYKGKVKNNIIKNLDEVEKSTAAGTKRNVKDRYLTHCHYLNTLKTLAHHYVTQNVIISKKHKICSVNQTKISLSAQDTKRYILNDGINTLAHGHFRTANGSAEEYPYRF